MTYTKHITLMLGLLLTTTIAIAQHNDPKQKTQNSSEIKVNRLDVIYEDEEYKGVVIDNKDERETENYFYQAPFIINNYDDDDDPDNTLPTFTLNDDGALSEDEILLEGFDTAAIHLPKLDANTITEPIEIELTNIARGEKFTWPTPINSRPTSHFGPRRRRFHYGLDLAQPTGEPIYAAFDGVVRISKLNSSYGNLVIIHHANGLETYYAHMSKRHVVAGQHVKSGDIIGLCGNTGRSFGSHLHFEVRYKGNPLNPENVVDCKTHDLISDRLTITSSSFRKVAKKGTASTQSSGTSSWYRVRQGDTLEKIARRNGTTVKQLCRLNNISQNKTLHPGDRLRVSGTAQTKTSTTQTNTNKTSSSKTTTAATYTVRKGDTLSRIAANNGTTVKKICQLNGISENSTLRVGQKIKLR